MSKGFQDDHYYPQSLLREWAIEDGLVTIAKLRYGKASISQPFVHRSGKNKSKIDVFHRPDYDKFFNIGRLQPDSLNFYRKRFENKIRDKVFTILARIDSMKVELQDEYELLSPYITESEKIFWIKYYFLSNIMNPYMQDNFEIWFRSLLPQILEPNFAAYILKQAGSMRISPSVIVDEIIIKHVRSFPEVFISFLTPSNKSYFIAAESYIPLGQFAFLENSLRMPWIPLHPKLLLRVFFQDAKTDKEQFQLRVFFEDPDIFNQEGIKFSREVLGTKSHRDFIVGNAHLFAK